MYFEIIKRLAIVMSIFLLLAIIPWLLHQERTKHTAEIMQRPNTLVILSWADYINPELIQAFEKYYNIKIETIYFHDDYHRNLIVEMDGSHRIDLVLLDEHALTWYRNKGWLAPLNEGLVSNLVHIDPMWLSRYPNAIGYAAPYMWGTTGLLYRSDLVREPISSWMQIFRPQPYLQGRIQAMYDPRELLMHALLALGYGINSENLSEYQEAIDLIFKQRGYVHTYASISMEETAEIVQGDVFVAMTYNGAARRLQQLERSLKYVIPLEGCKLWVDFFAVMAQSRNKQLAYQFVDFLNHPENAAKNSKFTQYASANRATEAYLEQDFLNDPMIFPDRNTMNHCDSQKSLPGWVQYQINKHLAHLVPQ